MPYHHYHDLLLYFFIIICLSSQISATTNYDHWFHLNYFSDLSNSTFIFFIPNYQKIYFFGKGSIRTESIISNLSVINFLVVRFHLVHFSVQVTNWWWYKSQHSLIGTEGICIDLIDIFRLQGVQQ